MSRPPSPDSLWHDMVAIYRDKALVDACLRLQDERGADVPLVLLLGLLDRARAAPDPAGVRRMVQAAVPWREAAVGPLRAVRRGLKALDLAPAERALREDIKRLELEAERLHVARLAAVAASAASAGSARAMRVYLELRAVSDGDAEAFVATFERACGRLPASDARTERGA